MLALVMKNRQIICHAAFLIFTVNLTLLAIIYALSQCESYCWM